MAAEIMPPSHSGVKNELVPERPLMSVRLFSAVMEGNEEVIMQCLGLSEERKEVKMQMEALEPATQTMTEHTVESELQSATSLGDTVLHLLVTKRHNALALRVFQMDTSLLKAKNKMFETPLHCAAKVGNEKIIEDFIHHQTSFVKDVLQETNDNGDTALHIAAEYGHAAVGRVLMMFNPEMAYKVNKQKSTPLFVAIANESSVMILTMLEVDATLACIQDSDGMFPIHVAARMGYDKLVAYMIEEYPKYAELLDPHGRNLFHIAAEYNQVIIFLRQYDSRKVGDMIVRMNSATDYRRNTPLHIAAMKGNELIMSIIWENKMHHVAESVRNNTYGTPLQLYVSNLRKEAKDEASLRILQKSRSYIKTHASKFTSRWFSDVMEPSIKNIWERSQVIGLGSVLITTIAFAAAITIPGDYQENGTPVLGKKYMFRAFTMANAIAFIAAFVSLYTILMKALTDPTKVALQFATYSFFVASSSMVVAFGLALYLTLAPNNMAIAILILVVTLLLGSPFVYFVPMIGGWVFSFFNTKPLIIIGGSIIIASHALVLLLIFCLAFL